MFIRLKHAKWEVLQQVFQKGILKIIRTKGLQHIKIEAVMWGFSANLEHSNYLFSTSVMPNWSLFIKTWQLACTNLMAWGLKKMHHKILRIQNVLLICFV